jgi:hypothetical protein
MIALVGVIGVKVLGGSISLVVMLGFLDTIVVLTRRGGPRGGSSGSDDEIEDFNPAAVSLFMFAFIL